MTGKAPKGSAAQALCRAALDPPKHLRAVLTQEDAVNKQPRDALFLLEAERGGVEGVQGALRPMRW